jgi:ribosome-associated translation inhibitor RaiA
MQTPLRISFHGLNGSPQIRDSVSENVTVLEKQFGRITACHVSVVGPGAHHLSGGQYQVRVHLALPNGREVNAECSPTADERFADLPFAINDAFHRARRQLQDHVRELQGRTKAHALQQ